MAAARAQLRREHGEIRWSRIMAETFELRPSDDGNVFAWEGVASHGGDINRLTVKAEGEVEDGDLHEAEIQALYTRAIGPYFNLNAGVRQDPEPRPRRTYATLGVDGVAPYWFEVGAALFLSDAGDVSARVEGAYDLRLTQRLILEPRAEANVAASADRALGAGAGLRDIELGVRLRYAVRPTVAPYVGVTWARRFGDTAEAARDRAERVEDTRLVLGLRAWF
jgi:copper resistance protein B